MSDLLGVFLRCDIGFGSHWTTCIEALPLLVRFRYCQLPFSTKGVVKSYFLMGDEYWTFKLFDLFGRQISALCSPMLCKAPNTSWGSSTDASTIWGSSSRSTWAERFHWWNLGNGWLGRGKKHNHHRKSKLYMKLPFKKAFNPNHYIGLRDLQFQPDVVWLQL